MSDQVFFIPSPSGGPPSGPAGGDLDGTYPNPQVVAFTTPNATQWLWGDLTDGQILTTSGGQIVSNALSVSLQDAYDAGETIVIPSLGAPVTLTATDPNSVVLFINGAADAVIQFDGATGGIINWLSTQPLRLQSGGVDGAQFGPDTHGNPFGLSLTRAAANTFLRYPDGQSLFLGPEAAAFGIVQLLQDIEVKFFRKLVFEENVSDHFKIEWNQAPGNLRLYGAPTDTYEVELPKTQPAATGDIVYVKNFTAPIAELGFDTLAFGSLMVTASGSNNTAAPTKAVMTTSLIAGAVNFDTGGVSNRLRYTGALTKWFRVGFTLDVDKIGAGAGNVNLSIFKNGLTLVQGSRVQEGFPAAITGVLITCGTALVQLATNDFVEVFINTGGGVNDTYDVVGDATGLGSIVIEQL